MIKESIKNVEEGFVEIAELVDEINEKILKMIADGKKTEDLRKLSKLHRLNIKIGESAIDAYTQACVVEHEVEDD